MPLTKDPNVPPQPGSRQAALIALQIFFVVVALFVFGLRVYTRRVILRSLGNDDYVMGVAVVRSFFSLCLSWASATFMLADVAASHTLQCTLFISSFQFISARKCSCHGSSSIAFPANNLLVPCPALFSYHPYLSPANPFPQFPIYSMQRF